MDRYRGNGEHETCARSVQRGSGKRTDCRHGDGAVVQLESERLTAADERDDHEQALDVRARAEDQSRRARDEAERVEDERHERQRSDGEAQRGPGPVDGILPAVGRRSHAPEGSLTLGTLMLIGAGTVGIASSAGTAVRRDGISASATISGSVLTPRTRFRPWSLAR